MRAWVGTPKIEEVVGGRLLIANRSDGYSVMMPADGLTPEQMQWQLDTYLDNGCSCDSSQSGVRCMVHREVMVA